VPRLIELSLSIVFSYPLIITLQTDGLICIYIPSFFFLVCIGYVVRGTKAIKKKRILNVDNSEYTRHSRSLFNHYYLKISNIFSCTPHITFQHSKMSTRHRLKKKKSIKIYVCRVCSSMCIDIL